jgi:transcriptional regulator with XRE-family HTH domain
MLASVNTWIHSHRLSQSEFGELLGVDRSYVSLLISGDRAPSVQVLRKIHELTRIPLKKLVYECT